VSRAAGGVDGGPARRRPGRRPGSADTKGRILGAARAAFADRGFDGATVREIAARAGVDPALVHHYFGTKQQLFVAAMEFPVDVGATFAALAAGPRETIGERIVRTFVEVWDRPEVRPMVLGLVRSAATDPVAAGMFRRLLAEGPLLALASAVEAPDAEQETPDAELRATLVGTQLIGIAMARYVAGLEPIASLRPDALATAVGPTLTRYLLGDLGGTNPDRVG
jgi:AcrR family transcriptional regulator